jgi:hypothetical protein
MDLQRFAITYLAKTDEELLALATQPAQLTPEARLALASEMAKRRIVDGGLGHIKEVSANRELSVDSRRSETPHISAGKFLEEVLILYHRRRWFFMKIVFPAVVISYLSVMLGRHLARPFMNELYTHIGTGQFNSLLVEVWIIVNASYVVSWLAYCVSFGVICAAVDQYYAGFEMSITDSFSEVRKRLGVCLQISLLLLFLLAGVVAAGNFASTWIFRLLQHYSVRLTYLATTAVFYIPTTIGLLGLTRFGLAIPAVVVDDLRSGQAIFRSDALTQGKWAILASLLAKAIVGGYVAGALPFWLARWTLGSHVAPWLYWLLVVLSLAAVALVEPVMFIGFGLLYAKTTSLPRTHEQLFVANV